jgi:hydroxymethylpyrimidine/phosphomethylpyrimidine kinase
MLRAAPPVVLTIAGFDPSSGAGATADLKTIAAHGCYGVCCLTALTVQSTRGVSRVEPISAEVVGATLQELAADVRLDAVKVGMLAAAPVADAVADFLVRVKPPKVVLDPVLKSTSGAQLLDRQGREGLVLRLLPLATVITPNLEEASALAGLAVRNLREMKAAARRLHQLGARNVVITGGHLPRPVDVLSMATASGFQQFEFTSGRVRSTSIRRTGTHGTGCAFSSAVACNLALGESLPDAVRLAKQYVTEALRNAYPVGEGAVPVNHFYALGKQLRARRTTSHAKVLLAAPRKTKKVAARSG